MRFRLQLLLLLLYLSSCSVVISRKTANDRSPQKYILTVYSPGYPLLHGLKVEHRGGLVTGFRDIEPICPGNVLFKPCPRAEHTETVFHSLMRPSSAIRKPQVLYAAREGFLRIAHGWITHLPANSVSAKHGWSWTSIPQPLAGTGTDAGTNMNANSSSLSFCHTDDPIYDCTPPTGVFKYWLPHKNSFFRGVLGKTPAPPYFSGVFLCRGLEAGEGRAVPTRKGLRQAMSVKVWSPTVHFRMMRYCTMVDGLATVPYDGPDPPVYRYD